MVTVLFLKDSLIDGFDLEIIGQLGCYNIEVLDIEVLIALRGRDRSGSGARRWCCRGEENVRGPFIRYETEDLTSGMKELNRTS